MQPFRGVLGKGVLKICSKFTGEYPCQSAISINLLCNLTNGLQFMQSSLCTSITVLLLLLRYFLSILKTKFWIRAYFAVFKITVGQRSLTVVKASATTDKPCRMITMTATTQTQQQFLLILIPLQVLLKQSLP